MKIKVKLCAILKKYAQGKISEDDTITLHNNATLQGLSSYLNIPDENGIVFLINESLKDKEFGLHEGDEVKIFSFIAGG